MVAITPHDRLLVDPEPVDFDDEEGFDLRRYWRIIWKHKWGIFGLALVVGLLVGLFAYSIQPIYRSTATLMFMGGNQTGVGSTQDQYWFWLAARDFQNTEYEILKSRELATATLKGLELEKHPEFDPFNRNRKPQFNVAINWREWIPKAWFPARADNEETKTAKISDAALVGWLRANLSVQPVRDTRLVKVSFTSHDPELAAFVVNTLAKAYIESDLEGRLGSMREASQWLSERLEGLREKVMESQTNLQGYREEAGLVSVEGMQNIYTEQLKQVAQKVVEARRRRTEAENLYRQARRLQGSQMRQLDSFPAVMSHPVIQTLKSQEVAAELRIAELSKRYGPRHPKMIGARTNLEAAQAKMTEAIDQVVEALRKGVPSRSRR